MADDFQRLLAGYRRAHRLLDIPGIAYFQSVHAFRLAFAARPMEMAVFVAAIWIPDHPSKDVAERHKGELSRMATGGPSTGWESGSRAGVIRSDTSGPRFASGTSARLARDALTSTVIEAFTRIIRLISNCSCHSPCR